MMPRPFSSLWIVPVSYMESALTVCTSASNIPNVCMASSICTKYGVLSEVFPGVVSTATIIPFSSFSYTLPCHNGYNRFIKGDEKSMGQLLHGCATTTQDNSQSNPK